MEKYYALVVLAAAFAVSPAVAFRGPLQYTFTGTFARGGVYPDTLTGILIFDDADLQSVGRGIEAFSLNVGSTHFDLSNIGFEDNPAGGFFIGGNPGGVFSVDSGGSAVDDFRLAFLPRSSPSGALLFASENSNPFVIGVQNPIPCPSTSISCSRFKPGVYSTSFALTRSNVVTGAVPEPTTWAMMLLGFGAMGVSMRRRHRQNITVRFQKA